jgi:xanthine dehydrogenase accessory factor
VSDDVLRALLDARERRERCALVTIASSRGSVPREAGAKMLVHADQRLVGTIGGGKFEALVAAEAIAALAAKTPLLKTYPLHECDVASFGAICGGEATVFIEPQILGEAIYLVGAGHCSRALARVAQDCGWHVTVVDDRAELLADFPAQQNIATPAPEFIANRTWQRDEALVLISRNHELDREALHAAVRTGGMGYLGMMGSRRKVRQVFDALIERGVPAEKLESVFSPIGLDVGAESPAEIAVSIMAEVLAVLRARSGAHLQSAPAVG